MIEQDKMADNKERSSATKREELSASEPIDLIKQPYSGLNKKSTCIKLSIGQKRKTDEKDHEKSQSNAKTCKKPAESSTVVSIEFAAKAEKDKNEPPILQEKKGSVAKAFGEDSDSEEEEMPKEARMKMRNMGRDTPTSAGPNSYNKGKQGFVNRNKMWDKDLKPRTHLEKPPGKS
eukprot:Seg3179.1 transcript_id=Seg3179.1/GoldUCD/mRNA.D3Y31 product="PEST proteolytic signal-containing nuclear protein" protein_id=Seg3179.1/GoldUCD/D3Y31